MKPISFVILALCCSLTFGQNYNINRQISRHQFNVRNGKSVDYDQPDLVQIPSSLCHNDGTTQCPSMDGRRYSVCQCTCNKTDSDHRFYKSTFGFYNGTWKCEKNSALRRRSGCQLSLDVKGLNDSIKTVPTTITDSPYFISNVTTTDYILIPEDITCSLKAVNSMYLTCSGEWKQLNTTLVTKRFNIGYRHYLDRNMVTIQVHNTESSSYPLPSGRIIRLAVTFTDRPWEPSQCILLKIEGQLHCPVSLPRPTTPPAQPQVVHPSFVPSLTSQLSPTTSSDRKPGGNINAPKKDSSMDFSTGLIIGISVSGAAVLAALIILVCFIIRLRKKRRIIENDRKSSTAELVLENKTYGERFGGAQFKPTDQMEEQADLEGQGRTTDELPMQEEPLYSVPGSIIDKNNSEQDEPFYYSLEEPQPHGAKKNDVHEELQPEKAPHVYGTFNEPHQTATSDDPRGYSNTLYDSVGDVSKQSK